MFKIRIPQTTKSLKLALLIIFTCVFLSVSIFPVSSKTLEEIEDEIGGKQEELESLEVALKKAKDSAVYYQSKKDSSSSELERVENELKQIEAEIQVNEMELKKIEQEIEILQLELEQKDEFIREKLVNLYIYNKQGIVDVFVENGQVDGFWKNYKYREKLLDTDLEDIASLGEEASRIKGEKDKLISSMTVLEEENERLVNKKSELMEQVSYYASLSSYNTNRQSGIRAQMGAVQQDIEGLTAEQKKMIDEEMHIVTNANGGTQPLVSGEFYFYGRGRSVYQGHGLGFSQYGAFGGAQSGMVADNIAKFYYQGSNISTASGNIEVIGYGTMNIEDYVSGLGEIPDRACGSQEQVNSRPDKYALDNPNSIWDCWPEESIKAQVIVARSFALAYGGPICTTATCQVYKGGQGKRWAADETNGKVLKVGGSIIKAYYSSDNNNGWGTATHRNPVWCGDFHGNCGAGYSWLQAVNDSSFAAKGPYTDWMWRTNSYTLSELRSMLEWYANAGYVYPKSSDVRNLLNNIGTLQDLRIERDVSGRAARVLVVGSSGSEKVNGDFFKRIFIFWVYNIQPSEEVDPIFSLTYYFRQVP